MDVTFLPWYPSNPYQEQLAKNLGRRGAQVTLLPRRDFLRPGFVLKSRPDVLHLHWLQAYTVARNVVLAWVKFFLFIINLLYVRSQNVRIVWTMHELRDHERRNPLLDRVCNRAVARLCDAYIAHCEAAKRIAVAELGLDADRVWIVPLGNYIDCYPNQITRAEARKSLGLPQGGLVLLFFGLIKPYKGVLELIDAFERVAGEDASLLIVGKPFREEFGEQIRKRIDGRKNIAFFPEFTPDDRIQVYLNACDCTVFPYRDVLSSSSILLSMTFARACIAPRIGCVAEDLDEEGSILYDPDEEDGLCRALRRAIERREELAAMGQHNGDRGRRASWDGIAEKTLAVYSGRSSVYSKGSP